MCERNILLPALGWRDYSMEWNYSEYGDVKVRNFSYSVVFVPLVQIIKLLFSSFIARTLEYHPKICGSQTYCFTTGWFFSSINEIRFAIVANENYFSANENFDATFPTKIVVSHNGDISQIPPGCEEMKICSLFSNKKVKC